MVNAGVRPPKRRRRLGHTDPMLLRRYANCVDGQEQVADERIVAALEDSEV